MNKTALILAGASGLVGHEILNGALVESSVVHVYTLTRRHLTIEHTKLTQCVSEDLSMPQHFHGNDTPLIGVIALGSTIKKAGSKEKLRAIDVDLVVSTAKKMQNSGVEHIIVVSCLGANEKALSHYLRCKGEMERQIEALAFVKTTFLQPGPLAGERSETRNDEKVLQAVFKTFKPLMKGRLAKYIPIHASTIASATLKIVNSNQLNAVERITSPEMINMIAS